MRLSAPKWFILYQMDLSIEANGVTPIPAVRQLSCGQSSPSYAPPTSKIVSNFAKSSLADPNGLESACLTTMRRSNSPIHHDPRHDLEGQHGAPECATLTLPTGGATTVPSLVFPLLAFSSRFAPRPFANAVVQSPAQRM